MPTENTPPTLNAEAMPNGDWYCPNCGYLSPQNVTHSETCDECHQPVEFHEVETRTAVERLESQLAEQQARADSLQPYKDALEDAAVCDWITDEHWSDPRKLIAAIIDWNMRIALDPTVSEEARSLRDTHLARAERAEAAALEIATKLTQQLIDTEAQLAALVGQTGETNDN